MNPPTLFNDSEGRKRFVKRRQADRRFRFWISLPTLLALVLVTLLLGYTLSNTVSWQVVEPDSDSSGQTFSLADAQTPSEVFKLELDARVGQKKLESTEAKGIEGDPEEMRKFYARNRIELMWYTQDGPLRWVVTHVRDVGVSNHSLIDGWIHLKDIQGNLKPGQQLRLNPWLDLSFFLRDPSRNPMTSGIRVALFGTLWILGLTLFLAVPIGVGTAIYLEEYASEGRWTALIEINLRNLAGVPSIVYGILGLAVFARGFHLGPSVATASLTLSLLIIPTIVIASREAIRAVPSSLRQAAYSLGATKWQTVYKVVLPTAASGMVTGVILAGARAIGEAAPLLLVGAAAFVPSAPTGIMSEYTVMPVQIYNWISANQPEYANAASAAIVTLLLILGLLYTLAFWVRRRFQN